MILASRKARSTGTKVYLEDMGVGYSDGRYMTVCEDHGGCVCHPTRKLAEGWLRAGSRTRKIGA